MSFKTRIALVAAAVLVVPAVLLVSAVQAHATIGTVAWDSTTTPTKVIATSRGQDIANEAGTFSVRVYDPSGREVTAGATRLTGAKTMEVNVGGTLVPGNYRVAWTTRSAGDGDDASGELFLLLPANPAPAPTTAAPAPVSPTTPTAPVAPPATGDAGLASSSAAGLLTLVVVASAALSTGLLVRGRRIS